MNLMIGMLGCDLFNVFLLNKTSGSFPTWFQEPNNFKVVNLYKNDSLILRYF